MPLEHQFSALVLFDNSGNQHTGLGSKPQWSKTAIFVLRGSFGPLRVGESCYAQRLKNPMLLPEKWARTSVVGILQQLHNQNALIQRLSCSQYAVRTTS